VCTLRKPACIISLRSLPTACVVQKLLGLALASHLAMASPNESLFFGDLPTGLGEAQCTEIFSQYGAVVSCKLMDNKVKCAAVIRFSCTEEASNVKDLLDGFIPQGLESAVTARFATTPRSVGKPAPPGVNTAGFNPYNAGSNGAQGMSGGGMGRGGMAMAGMGMGGAVSMGMGAAPQAAANAPASMDQICCALEASGVLPKAQSEEGTLYVGNLPADCQNEFLYRMFAPFGPVAAVRTMMHPGTTQCKGFGFVSYSVEASAQVAIASLNGMMLPDGRTLQVKVKSSQNSMPIPGAPRNFKTSMCTFFANGMCQRGEQCTYAHSPDEMQGSPRQLELGM